MNNELKQNTSETAVRYLLFDRHLIGKFENGVVYIRDEREHTWKRDNYITSDYIGPGDYITEEIDYDEDNEEITAIRRARGQWICEELIEKSAYPSEQVIRFFEKTGITYADIYGTYGAKGKKQGSIGELFDTYPDLMAGLPG